MASGVFDDALMENQRVREVRSEKELRAVLDPVTYIGRAPQIVDEVLARAKAGGWLN